ncbi:MAG: ATP-binding protein [Bacteroidota bacterium]
MVLENEIKNVIELQSNWLLARESGLKRELIPAISNLKSHALIISGIRRCGKSTLLLQIIEQLKNENILYLNFETPQLYNFSINDFSRLNNIIREQKYSYLFFDEIQLVKGWELFIREKIDEGYKIIITGSNASMLSSELGSKLTGRHITQELFPFSFSEYIQFKNLEPNSDSLNQYLIYGGFPGFLKSEDNEQLTTLFDDVLIRDIVARYGIKDIKSLQKLAMFLYSNIGNRITASGIKQPLSISATSTVLTWFSHMELSYLVFFLPAYCNSIRAQIVNPKKVYAIDIGMVNSVSVSASENIGRKLENLIFLQLRKKYKEIYYYSDKVECDFVVFKNGKVKELIQVCYELSPDNMYRETEGLKIAMAFFGQKKATIVTHSQNDVITEKWGEITIVSADIFLTKNNL